MALLCVAATSHSAPGDPLELTDCRIYAGPGYPGLKARCGTFERYLDPDDPQSTVLELNVAVVPALSLEPEPDPFVPIAGGPGGASVNFYASYARAFERIRRNRDILLIDARGTGESELMNCEFDDDVIEGTLSREETVKYTQECLDQLPHDPRFFTTSVAVRDLDALREALGYPAINVYGSSYGTRVAQHYARRYPDKTRTIILDGVVPPQLPLGPDIAVEAQAALDNIFARCEEDAACNETFPDISDRFADVEAQLVEESQELTISHPITGRMEEYSFGDDELAGTIRLMSYSPDTVSLMPLMIHAASEGNFTPLASMFVSVSESMSDALAIGMHNAVVCTEDVPFFENIDFDALKLTYIGPMMTEALIDICSVWPKGVLDDDLRVPLATDLPVLLLSGSADPVTPPAFGDLAAVALENARHLTGLNQGHGLAGQGCMPDIIGQFVEDASFDEIDTECMEQLFAMPFFLDFTGPSP